MNEHPAPFQQPPPRWAIWSLYGLIVFGLIVTVLALFVV